MSSSVVLPLGCRPLPRTPKQIFSPHVKKHTNDLNLCLDTMFEKDLNFCLDTMFEKELVFQSSPLPQKPQPMIPVPVVVPGNGTPSGSNFIWKERPQPKLPVVVPDEEIDSPTAFQFIRKTPMEQGSATFLSVSPAGSSPSPQMKRWRRQVSSGLLLEEDLDWDEKKVVPARDMWLKARRLLRQAGLNPRNVTLVSPGEENTEECKTSSRKVWKRANSDSLVSGGTLFLTDLESRKTGDEDSTSRSVPQDALSKLLDEQHKSQQSRPTSEASSRRPMSEASTKSVLECPKVRRVRMAAVGAASLWTRKPTTV